MVDVFLKFSNSDSLADTLARRCVVELRDAPGVGDAWLVRRDAREGERGIIEELGAFGIKLAAGQGAAALLGFVRTVLGRSGEREVIVRLPNGAEFTLKGSDVSDEQFDRVTLSLLSLMKRSGRGEET